MIKKIAFASIALVASSQLYATACTGGVDASCNITAGNSTAGHTYTPADGFVVTEFDFTTSANVMMTTMENEAGAGASAASAKGRNYYSGSTFGGSVAPCGDAYSGSAGITSVPDPDLTMVSGCAADGIAL